MKKSVWSTRILLWSQLNMTWRPNERGLRGIRQTRLFFQVSYGLDSILAAFSIRGKSLGPHNFIFWRWNTDRGMFAWLKDIFSIPDRFQLWMNPACHLLPPQSLRWKISGALQQHTPVACTKFANGFLGKRASGMVESTHFCLWEKRWAAQICLVNRISSGIYTVRINMGPDLVGWAAWGPTSSSASSNWLISAWEIDLHVYIWLRLRTAISCGFLSIGWRSRHGNLYFFASTLLNFAPCIAKLGSE
jgi:hypothetical protein